MAKKVPSKDYLISLLWFLIPALVCIYVYHNFKSTLKATTMTSPDIRAGISLLIAALSAKGTSTIHNIEQIDRGYENIDERLKAIGAKIERVA